MGTIKWIVVLAVFVGIAAAAYALYAPAQAPGDGTSGIHGTVVRGPNCPVEQEGVPCPIPPYFETKVLVYRSGSSRTYATTQSDAQGVFSIAVPPGAYTVNAENSGIAQTCTPQDVSVAADAFVNIIVSCDTGIR